MMVIPGWGGKGGRGRRRGGGGHEDEVNIW